MSFTIAHITDPHLSPAPMPGLADLRLKRVMGFINWKRGARTAERHGAPEAPGRGLARPASRSCRGHRGSGQYRHGGRVPARGAVDGDVGRAGRRQLRAWQSRRLCTRVHAFARIDIRAVGDERRCARQQRRCARQQGDLPLPSGPWGDRNHRPELSRADRSLDGDGQARQGATRGVRRSAAPDRRQRPGAGRAHPPPAARRSDAPTARSFGCDRVSNESCATSAPRRSCTAIPTGRLSAPFPPALHARSAARFPSSGLPRPLRPRVTRAIAPPITWCGSIARASAGGSGRAPGGSTRRARRSGEREAIGV